MGQSASFLARQIIYRIDDNTLNVGNDKEMDMLAELHAKLGAVLAGREKAS